MDNYSFIAQNIVGGYLRNRAIHEFDRYLSEISIKNPNFWYMSWVTAFDSETFYNFYWGEKLSEVSPEK